MENNSDNPVHNFETQLNSLEKLVEKMDSGELNLEDAVKHFESGMKLVDQCQTALDTAQQKVDIILQKQKSSDLNNIDNHLNNDHK